MENQNAALIKLLKANKEKIVVGSQMKKRYK
jgi:hypothetical protein